jgi:hypothetical protein
MTLYEVERFERLSEFFSGIREPETAALIMAAAVAIKKAIEFQDDIATTLNCAPDTVMAAIEALKLDAARYRWTLQQSWFQSACDRFDFGDDGLQAPFEKYYGEMADAAMQADKE